MQRRLLDGILSNRGIAIFLMLNCLEEINNLSEHFIYENNFDKAMLVLKFEEVKPYENFIHKSSVPVCY